MRRLPECEQFPGRLNEVCNGTALVDGKLIDPEWVTAWRAQKGLPPIGEPVDLSKIPKFEYPPMLLKAINFAAAMVRWAAAGLPTRTQEQIDERLTVCKACSEFVNDHCQVCGCACNDEKRQLMNKLVIATESCPLGKWT